MVPEIIITALIVGWLLHGKFMRLADVQLKYVWMIFVPLGLYVAALITNYAHVFRPYSWVFGLVHVVGFASMMVVALANRHIPGVKLMFAGLALNVIAIIVNGGFMPTATGAIKTVFGDGAMKLMDSAVRHALINSSTRLSFLCDVIAARRPFVILPSIYSIGDLITSLGGLIAIVAIMRSPRYSKQSALKEA